jgi:hypothetical protein
MSFFESSFASRSAARIWLFGALAFVVGVVVMTLQTTAISAAHDLRREGMEREIAWWREKNAALMAERKDLRQKVQSPPVTAAGPQALHQVRMEALLSIAELFGTKINGTPTARFSGYQGTNAISPADAEGLVSDMYIGFSGRFADLFGLGEAQVRALQLAFDRLRQRIIEDVTTRITVSFPRPDQLVVQIQPSPAATAYHEELLTVLRETLGETGASAFAKINGVSGAGWPAHQNALDEYFCYFGRDSTTYTITKEAEGYTYVVSGSPGVMNTRLIQIPNLARINWTFPPAAKLVPAGF